jgi:RNA-binding protein YlmH
MTATSHACKLCSADRASAQAAVMIIEVDSGCLERTSQLQVLMWKAVSSMRLEAMAESFLKTVRQWVLGEQHL